MKSSALLWLPLLWIASQASTRDALRAKIRFIRHSAIQVVMRGWSFIVLLLFAGKLWLWYNWAWLHDGWAGIFPDAQLQTLATQFVWPSGLPLWQLLGAMNGAISIALWFWAQDLAVRMDAAAEGGAPVAEGAEVRRLKVVNVIRSSITVYVIGSSLWKLVSTGLDLDLPPLDILIAPWSDRPEIRLFDN